MPIILHLAVFSYYIMDRKMILKSDLTELQADLTELRGRFDSATKAIVIGWLSYETFLWHLRSY